MRLKIQKWDPSKIKPHRIILLIGRRGTGKSSMMEDILFHIAPGIDIALAMSPTEESLGMFRNHMPEPWLFNGFSQSKVEEMIEMQRSMAHQSKAKSILLALDDCLYEKSIMRSTAMRNIHMNGRHLHVTMINAAQYLVDIDPALRTQIDYVVCLKENIWTNRQRLHRFFFGCFHSFEEFSRVLEKVTENYGALVLDNTATSSNLSDCIYWYRASLNLPSYRIGRPIFWKLAERYAKTREQADRDRRQMSSNPRAGKGREKLTCVQRKDEHGRVLPEDRDGDVMMLC
jgi:hypothetical protein